MTDVTDMPKSLNNIEAATKLAAKPTFQEKVDGILGLMLVRDQMEARIHELQARAEKAEAALEWVRVNYAAGSTKEINSRIDAALPRLCTKAEWEAKYGDKP